MLAVTAQQKKEHNRKKRSEKKKERTGKKKWREEEERETALSGSTSALNEEGLPTARATLPEGDRVLLQLLGALFADLAGAGGGNTDPFPSVRDTHDALVFVQVSQIP